MRRKRVADVAPLSLLFRADGDRGPRPGSRDKQYWPVLELTAAASSTTCETPVAFAFAVASTTMNPRCYGLVTRAT
jgi:hypothetical protein